MSFPYEDYGNRIRSYRQKLGLSQSKVAEEMNVTPGYISNVENGRTAMSLRLLTYYAKIMNITLDSLVGELDPEYKKSALDNALLAEISKLDIDKKQKLLDTIRIWNQ